jgi:hypothetical protein
MQVLSGLACLTALVCRESLKMKLYTFLIRLTKLLLSFFATRLQGRL